MDKSYEYCFRYISDDLQEDVLGCRLHIRSELFIKVCSSNLDYALLSADKQLLDICNSRGLLYHLFDLDSFHRVLL